MDHSHAHAVFLEITFGLNTVLAIYRDFRDRIVALVEEKVSATAAWTDTLETGDRVDKKKVADRVSELSKAHRRFQDMLYPWLSSLAILCAVSAVVIIYFDLLQQCGFGCGFLILPLPLYIAISFGNYWIFQMRSGSELNRFKEFVDDFVLPSVPKIDAPPTKKAADIPEEKPKA